MVEGNLAMVKLVTEGWQHYQGTGKLSGWLRGVATVTKSGKLPNADKVYKELIWLSKVATKLRTSGYKVGD